MTDMLFIFNDMSFGTFPRSNSIPQKITKRLRRVVLIQQTRVPGALVQ
jgi:hypothetical protein